MAQFFEAASHFDLPDHRARLDDIIERAHTTGDVPLSRCDGDGLTLLHFACREGHLEAVKKLIVAGAALEQQDRLGRTPLHLACMMALKGGSRAREHVEIVHLLEEHDAVTGTQDVYGRTPLSYLPREAKRVGIGTKAVDGSGGAWEVQQVLRGGTVSKGSVAVAAEIQQS